MTCPFRETGAAVWELLDLGAHLYVCGDAKMMAKVLVLLSNLKSIWKLWILFSGCEEYYRRDLQRFW